MTEMETYMKARCSQSTLLWSRTVSDGWSIKAALFMKVFGIIILSKESARSYTIMAMSMKASSRTISRMASEWNRWWQPESAIRGSGRTGRWQDTANILSALQTTRYTKGSSFKETSMEKELSRLITTFITACSNTDNMMDLEGSRIYKPR